MTKIRDIVKINSGYTSYVDLYEDYNDLVKNRGRMERYKPIAAHRQVFEKIANALNPLDRRFYFLSGSYGTGKSHLLLMMANYFASSSDLPELEAFFKNYEMAQSEVLLKPGEELKERKAASLKEARKSGRFLVALCRYSLNLDFEGALLRALEEALLKDESNIFVDSHYREALRRINDWELRRNDTRFFSDFEVAISRLFPDWTVNNLIDGLEKYSEQALKAFTSCFQSVTDSEFTYKKDNLRDIISDFLKNPEFKERYKGIVFIYDEFGAAIDAGLVNYTTLLDFAQYCATSTLERGGTVVFIGTGHKAFRNHGTVGDLNAETLEARVSEIGLQTQGMEDIIAAIVQPIKDSSEWIHQVLPQSQKFTNFTVDCNRLHLFNWLPAPKIKNNIIQNIYPMHPLATYALLRLAGEAGSDNRSVFKFFAPEFETGDQGWRNVQPNSYPWFLETTDILNQSKLSLYTADLLVDYFKDSLKRSNNRLLDRVRNSVDNYDATLNELKLYYSRRSQQQLFEEEDQLILRIIKVMLVNEIASTHDVSIANNLQNIEFALDLVSPEEKPLVEDRMKLLCEAGILFNNNGVYELVRSGRKSVQQLVDQFKSNPENQPGNLLENFKALNPLRGDENYLEAKDYNASFNEDKRLKVLFASPSMLSAKLTVNGEQVTFFQAQEQERQKPTGANYSYEGVAVYAFCEEDSDIDQAKMMVAQNNQQRIVVAIPKIPIKVRDAIFTLNTFKSDWYKLQAQNFGPYERAEENRIRNEALKELSEVKADYFNNAKVYWFGVNGIDIPVQENKRHDVANKMMQGLYADKRNTFGHNEFNRVHINLSGSVRAIFKEGGDILCDLSQPIRVNWSWPDNRGGTKYLRKCFVDHQALRVISIEGDVRYLEAEKEISKFRTALPAYAKFLEDLAALQGKGKRNLSAFLKPFFEEYGQGEISVTMMLLLARRFFGDSLRFKREPNNLTDIQFSSTEEMLSLIQGEYPSAVILFEPVSVEDQNYFAKITQLFTNQPAPAGKVYTINEAFQAAVNWWNGLPVIARSLGFYPVDEKPLAELFSQARTRDPFRFIKYDLMEQLGQTPGETLTPVKITHIEVHLKAFKTAAEAVQANVENEILNQVADLFGAASHLDLDIQEGLKNWYNSLGSAQKDPLGSYHNNDSRPLVQYTSYTNLRELLFKTWPEAYSLGAVNTWISNYVTPLMQHIQNGKSHIENDAPKVGKLKVDFTNHISSKTGNRVTYQGNLTIHVNTEDGQGTIYVTEDGSDPTASLTRRPLQPGETLIVEGNKKIKLAVADAKGSYGSVETIEAINELLKYRIIPPTVLPGIDAFTNFVFPKDKITSGETLKSMFAELSQRGYYSEGELRQVIQHILDEIKE